VSQDNSQTILIIDDHPETLHLTSIVLKRHGFHVHEALTGPDGIDIALREPIDLILLDIMMPGMDGFEVCRQIRANRRIGRIPIVMFTARSQAADRKIALESGANDYVIKPLRPNILVEHVKATLASVTPTEASTASISDKPSAIVVVGVRSTPESTFVNINLAACLRTLGHVTASVQTGPAESAEQLQTALVAAVSDASAQPDDRRTFLFAHLNTVDPHDLETLRQQTDHFIVCFSPNLHDMSLTQSLLQTVQDGTSPGYKLQALLIDLHGESQLTKSTVTGLLQYQLLDIIQVESEMVATADAAGQPFVIAYPHHHATHKLMQIAASLVIS
jgi:DNA-binding response OmpR family regulator